MDLPPSSLVGWRGLFVDVCLTGIQIVLFKLTYINICGYLLRLMNVKFLKDMDDTLMH